MSPPGSQPDYHEHVVAKLSRVLGPSRATALLDEVLSQLRVPRISTLGHMEAVAVALQARSGFDATVGAMLAVDVALARLRTNLEDE